jgi:N-acetylmuramoyl-L-alanine amidase
MKETADMSFSHTSKKLVFVFFLTGFLFCSFAVDAVLARSARDMYFEAETAYKKLRNNPQGMKYRSNWLNCIKRFQAVYESDPKGPWAPAGLFMTGQLYWELYGHSYASGDKKAAEKAFNSIIDQFPGSQYRKRSVDFLARIGVPAAPEKTASVKKVQPETLARDLFYKARSCYDDLLKNPARQKYRSRWLDCIAKFEAVYQADPAGPWAAAGLFMTGQLYDGLSGYSFNDNDKRQAQLLYQQVIRDFPESRYRKQAENRIILTDKRPKATADGSSARPVTTSGSDEIAGIISKGVSVSQTRPEIFSLPTGSTLISGIRYWSNPNYTRVVIDAEGAVNYGTPHLLDENPAFNKPQRLYFDIRASQLDQNLKTFIPIDDNLLSAVRAAQYTTDTVRVVIDIKSFTTYKIFPLLEPSRIVVDVWGAEGLSRIESGPKTPSFSSNDKIPSGALARQLALGVRRVVIDAGHGGKDPGALGYLKNVYEKDVTLDMARKLAVKIEKELKCEVFLTRDSDRYLSLEARTAFANAKNADLFISIHANAHKNRQAYGIETYYLNLATDDESIRVAARENATSEKNISDLHSILSDLMQNAKINESSRLAYYVQSSTYENLKSRHSHVRNNGVKKAPFYVLMGAQMPAILIEAGFISNERECKRLINSIYQDQVCDGIVNGIRMYINETSPATLSRN